MESLYFLITNFIYYHEDIFTSARMEFHCGTATMYILTVTISRQTYSSEQVPLRTSIYNFARYVCEI